MISVVLADPRGGEPLRAALAALAGPVETAGGELVVVTAGDDPAGTVAAMAPRAVRVNAEPDALVPRLWGAGIERSHGSWIALASTDCPPDDDWVRAILRATAAHPEAAAVGGPVDPPERGRSSDWAVYFVRFSAFLDASEGVARELPGENVTYRRDALYGDDQRTGERREGGWCDRAEGFWEAFVHRRLEDLGETLRADPRLRVRAASGGAFAPRVAERLRHGRHFGAHRPLRGPREAIARALAAPLVPALLTLRAGRRVARTRPDLLPRYAAALPWIVMLFAAWSVGEARGYLDQRKRMRTPTNSTPARGR